MARVEYLYNHHDRRPQSQEQITEHASVIPRNVLSNLRLKNVDVFNIDITDINDTNLQALAGKSVELLIREQDRLLFELVAWFSADRDRWSIIHMLKTTGKIHGIPLRTLDHFVVNYTKENIVMYLGPDGEPFDVYASYKDNISIYTKEGFDFVARTNTNKRNARIKLANKSVTFLVRESEHDPNKKISIRSNVRQLNIFRWAIKNGVLDYVIQHRQQIVDHHKKTLEKQPKRKAIGRNGQKVDKKRKLTTRAGIILQKKQKSSYIGI